jgi:hypothetical protein
VRLRYALPAGKLPSEPFWLFRDARWRCLDVTKSDLQPEWVEMEERDVATKAESQIQRLDPMQLAIWISAAPDPQRTALALFYLDEFDYREILEIAELKLSELSRFLAKGAAIAGMARFEISSSRQRYEPTVIIAPATLSFKLRSDQRASAGRPSHALGNISCRRLCRICRSTKFRSRRRTTG